MAYKTRNSSPRKAFRRVLKPSGAVILLTAIILCTLLSGARAATGTLGEYRIKALYIYNLSKFVTWPDDVLADPNEPIRLCVIGEDPFGDAFKRVAGKLIRNHPFTVTRLQEWEDVPNDCHLLFIGISDSRERQRVLEAVKQRSILTISDLNGFASQGGIVGFIIKDKKVRMVINLEAARKAELQISSDILKLVDVIE